MHLYVTGFQTSDEVNYILDAMVDQPYGARYFFDYQLAILFKLFSVDSIARFLVFFPFYLVFWTFSFLILAYKTLNLVTQKRYASNFVIFSLPFAISYSVLSVGLLTEGPGLTVCMLGIYSWLRYVKVKSRWYYAALSSAAFVAAAYSREPYVVFPVTASLAWIALAIAKKVPLHHTIIFVGIALIIAAPSSTFSGSVGAIVALPALVGPTTQVSQSITQVSSSTTQVLPSPGLFSGWTLVLTNSVVLFLVGIVLGWGPFLFLISVVAFTLILKIKPRREIPRLRLFIILVSLGTFYGAVFTQFYQIHFYLTQGLSNLVRLTNTAIPAYLLLSPILYERLSEKRIKLLAVILITLTAGSAEAYATVVQTNLQLPYNVIDFSHQTATLEARNYLLRNASVDTPTVVFLLLAWHGGELYLRDIPGIAMYPSIQNPNYLTEARDSNYTEALFIRLHPTTFYVFSESTLSAWNASAPLSSNVQNIMSYQSVFLDKTYGTLFHADTSSYGSTPYSITSDQIVFSSPTGHLLKVHVRWSGT